MLFTFLLIVHALVAALLVTVILMQKSEGGGLGMGGSPSGLMSARGAADFLTRATTVLAVAFVAMSILLAGLASYSRGPRTIDTSLAHTAPASQSPTSDVPLAGDPLSPVAGAVATNPGPVTPEAPAGETIPQVRPKPGAPTPAATAPVSTATMAPPATVKTVEHQTSSAPAAAGTATSPQPETKSATPTPTPVVTAPNPKPTTPPLAAAGTSSAPPSTPAATPAPVQEKAPPPASNGQ